MLVSDLILGSRAQSNKPSIAKPRRIFVVWRDLHIAVLINSVENLLSTLQTPATKKYDKRISGRSLHA
jgi:hypothetical protein